MELPANLIEMRIVRGAILHSTMFKDIDHGKFFVIMGVSATHVAGFFFINSNIHPSLRNKPEQFAMQYPMRKADYTFLRYDSFLCATHIMRIERHRLAQSIQRGETCVLGNMHPAHIEELFERVKTSRLFSKRDIEDFFE